MGRTRQNGKHCCKNFSQHTSDNKMFSILVFLYRAANFPVTQNPDWKRQIPRHLLVKSGNGWWFLYCVQTFLAACGWTTICCNLLGGGTALLLRISLDVSNFLNCLMLKRHKTLFKWWWRLSGSVSQHVLLDIRNCLSFGIRKQSVSIF